MQVFSMPSWTTQPPHSPRPVLSQPGTRCLPRLPAPSRTACPVRLYIDNAKMSATRPPSASSARHFDRAHASLSAEGRGKIERYFRTDFQMNS